MDNRLRLTQDINIDKYFASIFTIVNIEFIRRKKTAPFIQRSINHCFVLVTKLCSIAIKSDILESVRS